MMRARDIPGPPDGVLGPGSAWTSMPSRPGEEAALLGALMDRVRPVAGRTAEGGGPGRLRVTRDRWGCPCIAGSAAPCSVSFSRQGGRTWAALSLQGRVGVDAASPDEFEEPYPFHRVFHDVEWTGAAPFCAGDRRDGAALLWTLKEAAVKALGLGFVGLDPLEVIVRPRREEGPGLRFTVRARSARLRARSMRERGRWLSLALWEVGP